MKQATTTRNTTPIADAQSKAAPRRGATGWWSLWSAVAVVLACATLLPPPLSAQVASYGDKQTGENSGDQLPQVLQKVKVEQHLNQQLPLNAAFVDETGKPVHLSDYFGQHPALLTMVYYN
jgi:protein SCO1/2